MMEESNGRTLPFVITDSFEIANSSIVYRLLGPPSIGITSFCYLIFNHLIIEGLYQNNNTMSTDFDRIKKTRCSALLREIE